MHSGGRAIVQPRLLSVAGDRDDRATPQAFFDALNAEFGFTLDAAATHENAKCARYYTDEDDGLMQPWDGVVWCNPPYGRGLGEWVKKGYESAQNGATVVMLLPASTDTIWFHEFCLCAEIRFIKGRLKFEGQIGRAPFPSLVVVFRPLESAP